MLKNGTRAHGHTSCMRWSNHFLSSMHIQVSMLCPWNLKLFSLASLVRRLRKPSTLSSCLRCLAGKRFPSGCNPPLSLEAHGGWKLATPTFWQLHQRNWLGTRGYNNHQQSLFSISPDKICSTTWWHWDGFILCPKSAGPSPTVAPFQAGSF